MKMMNQLQCCVFDSWTSSRVQHFVLDKHTTKMKILISSQFLICHDSTPPIRHITAESHAGVVRSKPPIQSEIAYLREHRLAVVGHHQSLVTVEDDRCVVKRFLGVLQYEVEIRHSPLEYAPEISWDQGSTNSCRETRNFSSKCSHQASYGLFQFHPLFHCSFI